MGNFQKLEAIERGCEKMVKASVIVGAGALALGFGASLFHDIKERREIKKQNKLFINNQKGGK